MLFNRLFGRKNSDSASTSSKGVKLNKKNHQPRRMTMEPLESRDLLTVTTGAIDNTEYAEIRAQYPDFELPEQQTDLNVMTITPDDGALSLADLKSAIANAGTTQKPDLILVRTSATANSVTYASNMDELIININASQYGSVTIIGLGEENFTLDANQQSCVMSVSGSSIVNLGGLTIQNGKTSGSGGGIYNFDGTLTVTNSTISGNTASASGGGIYNYYGTTTITNSEISGNTASSRGGGICNYATLTVTSSLFAENITSEGGGIYTSSGNITIANCEFLGNTASDGGGIYFYDGDHTITNCEIAGNSASSNGGGIYNYGSYATLTVTNSTIAGNTASTGGGIYADASSITNVFNSIVACNSSANDGSDFYCVDSSSINAFNCLSSYTQWDDGADNIVYDESLPLFIDAINGNYRLVVASQAIDMGENQYSVDADGLSLTADLANAPRIQGKSVDIGAYEFDMRNQLDVPEFSLTANGSAVTVTISEVENASSYTVLYQIDGADYWRTITNIQGASATFVGLVNTAYNVRVQANGNEYYSDSNYSAVQRITIADDYSAQNDFVKTTLNTPAVIDYRANDEATDWSLTTVQFGEASHGEFIVNEDGTIVYTPEEGFYGTDGIGYVLVSPSGKLSPSFISISVGLPIATSVQKTSGAHTPSSAMAASVDSLTEWDSCYIELWAQGVTELSAGETTITMSYNPAVYAAPTFAACADGAVLSVSQGVELPDGSVQVELTVSTTQALSSQTDNLFLGTVVLTPSMEQGAGIADPLDTQSICALDGVNLTTTVETMPYDLTHSGKVDIDDFVAFATVFGLKPGDMSPDNPLYAQAVKADFNKDGVINVDDFIAFATNFGASKSAAVKPVAQPGAAAEQVGNEELGTRSFASGVNPPMEETQEVQLEFPVSQSSSSGEGVIALPLVAPLSPSNNATLETEAYSAALLDLYDNQNESVTPEPLSAKAVDESIDLELNSFDFLFEESDCDADDNSAVDLSAVLDELELELI